MYGKGSGAFENCTLTVPPFEGYREGHLLFCSEEHAALDQAEQVM